MIDKAIAIIKNIVTEVEPGMIFTGKVVRMMNFGAFVELAPNKDGMVHISKLSDKRVAKVEDVVKIGDEVTVRGRGSRPDGQNQPDHASRGHDG